MSLLEVRNLYKSYSENGKESVAIEDVTFSVEEGELVCIVGRSGCGKSLLLRNIMGLEEPTGGTITFAGEPIRGPNTRMAMVFQHFALLPWMDVRQNIELGLEARGIPEQKKKELVAKYIAMVGLEGTESAYPKELSSGMKQRASIARALAVEPWLLCLDEPLSQLDKLTATTIREEMLLLIANPDIPLKSAIMVTHNIEEAVYMADRIIVLSKAPARSVAQLKVNLERPRHQRSEEFLNYVDKVYSLLS